MEELIEYFNTQGITDPRVQANIIAQVQRESGGKPQTESLNYSAKRALEVFPKYFKNLEEAQTVLAQGPEAFANRIYGGRMGNEPGEGYKYRGRGLIQLTGKNNYKKYGDLLGVDLVNNPELANDPVIAQKIASSYYLNKGKGKDLSDINVVNKLTGFVDKGGESQKRIDLANKIYKDLKPQEKNVKEPGFFRSTLTGIRNLLPFKKGGRVIKTKPIEVSARSLFDIQENARRSMMHGNYQDRMDDYAYAREQARRPYVNRYPVDSRGRGARSTAAPMRNQAARMMGFAKGGLINTQGPRPMNNLKTQAQGLAALGRGGDSTLVHMQPEEVAGLQQLAQANGTSLTINPATGMPEAFNLGNMFKAALPIAAGYFTGGAASPFFGSGALGSMLSKPIVAGALTGAGVAAASGDDPIMGAVTGGFGGSSGAGLNKALMGPGGGYNPFSGGSAVPNPGTYNPALDSTLSTAGGGAAPMAQGPAFGNTNPGAGFLDNMKMNLGETNIVTRPLPGGAPNQVGQFQEFKPAGNLQVANAIGGPAASLALGGLEESDFYEEVDFSDPRDKYDPNSKLNLNRDTGIAAALQKDTGLRLYAEGGEVGGGVTGAGLAPGTPVASIGGGVTGRGLPPGAPVAGAMGGAKPHAAPGMESFDSMVASGVHPANAAAMHGMDPRPFLGVPAAPAAGYARKPEVMESPYGASTRSRSTYGGRPKRYATGGYLNTGGEIGDGMSDDIQATINNNQPAALSDGEFVVPADVVSHLGNGSSDAGAKRLYDMMDKVRKARTGTTKQGREINPEKMMPK